MGSLAIAGEVSAAAPWQRRVRAEWELLQELVSVNPGRLSGAAADDLTLRVSLHATPAWTLAPEGRPGEILTDHQVKIVLPRYFPAVPLELYLETPVLHPNIDPANGFCCLWDQHRVSNGVEHAMHKLVAMLGWRLWNADAVHVMQPGAAAWMLDASVAASVAAPSLRGVLRAEEPRTVDALRRSRLS